MTVAEAVDGFLAGYFGTCSRSAKTRSAYALDLRQFRDYVGQSILLECILPGTLESWARDLQLREYAATSIRRKFASARVLFSYWIRRGTISSSPMWRLRLSLGREKVLPRSLSPGDSRLLIEQAWREQSDLAPSGAVVFNPRFLRERDLAIIEVLFATGMRVGEIVKLRIADWRPDEASLLVRGKGARERLSFLPDDRSLRAVKTYVTSRQQIPAPTDALFLNAAGKPISEQGVALTLSRIATAAQISKRVTPHMIRHTVATLLLRYGADIRLVQEVLGHASIATTQRYVHVAKDHLLATLRVKHPNHHLGVETSWARSA